MEDLPKDIRSGSYNPLCCRFAPEDAALRPEDKKQLLSTVDASISMAASALELLDPQPETSCCATLFIMDYPPCFAAFPNNASASAGGTKKGTDCMKDPYEVLGVPKGASQDEIKKPTGSLPGNTTPTTTPGILWLTLPRKK